MRTVREKDIYQFRILKAGHLAVSCVLFFAFWMLFRYGTLFPAMHRGFRYNFFVLLAYVVLHYWFSITYNSYLLGYLRIRNLVFGQFLSQVFSVAIIYVMVTIGWERMLPPWYLIVMLALQLVLDVVWSYFISKYYRKRNPRRKTLLVYRNEQDKRRFGEVRGAPAGRMYEIKDEIRYDGSFTDLEPYLAGYDAIFVAGVNSRCRNGILKYCKENNIYGFVLPHVGDIIMQDARHIKSFDSPVLCVTKKVNRPEYLFFKRAFDICSSGIALLILSPLMLVTALAIHFYDGGPALYKQVRPTKDGKEFKILKFRSMRVDAESDGVARLSTGDNDSRITPIGRIIRKFRLDELPQLVNIFVGDMSVVGPRPERPEIAEEYYKTIPDFKLRLQVKAGLTGYAQVYGKYNTDPYQKLEFDLLYINHMSVMTDLQLCFATFAILFSKESTAGVEEGAVTAMGYEIEDEAPEGRLEEAVAASK